MYRYLSVIALSILTFLTVNIFAVQAQGATLLPGTDEEEDACVKIINEFVSSGVFPTNQEIKDIEAAQSAFDDAAIGYLELNNKYLELEDKAAETAEAYMKKDKDGKNCSDKFGSDDFTEECRDLQADNILAVKEAKEVDKEVKAAEKKVDDTTSKLNKANPEGKDPETLIGVKDNLLGCAIKTGRISLNMIPHFISYMANWLLGLSGIISVLFIVLGGYYYIYGGLTDQKEKGKKTVANALMGMSLAILSWVIVSIIIAAVTS